MIALLTWMMMLMRLRCQRALGRHRIGGWPSTSDAEISGGQHQHRLARSPKLAHSTSRPRDSAPASIDSWERTYARDWRFLATNAPVEFGEAKGQGLALPDPVLRKIYHDNAVRWFPGILKGGH